MLPRAARLTLAPSEAGVKRDIMAGFRWELRAETAPAMALAALGSLLLLGGCTTPLPPKDPHQAWVDLVLREPAVDASLLAEAQDGKRLDDGRYFQLTPGSHSLKVSYRYELYGGGGFGSRFGCSGSRQPKRCRSSAIWNWTIRTSRPAGAIAWRPRTPLARARSPSTTARANW